MTLEDIKERVMFQTNNDSDDVGDYLPHLLDYINDGYDRVVEAYAHQHLGDDYPKLEEPEQGQDSPSPNLPEWMHQCIADWATWLVYRNGNPNKQSRGVPFKTSFEEVLAKIRGQGGEEGINADGTLKAYLYFSNIPR